MFVALALMTAFAWFHIELTAKVLGVALIGEVLALLVAVRRDHRHAAAPEGFSAAPLNPANIFDNAAAVEVFGAAAAGVAHLRRVLVVGRASRWRPTTPRSRATRSKIAKTATYGSVIGLGVFYIFVSYVFVTGWGLTGSAQAVRRPVRGRDTPPRSTR